VGADGALQGLTLYDSNADGIISNVDIRFGELQIWVDANENGINDTGELRSLEEVGIASLSLDRQGTNDRTKVGRNIVQATSSFTRTDGTTGSVGETALSFTPGALSIQERSLPDVSNVSFDDLLNDRLDTVSNTNGLSLRSGDNGTTLELLEETEELNVRSADGAITSAAFEVEDSEVSTSDVESTIEAVESDTADVETSDGAVTVEAVEPDSDALRLALIAQDMISFGATSGLETLRRQIAGSSVTDIFVA